MGSEVSTPEGRAVSTFLDSDLYREFSYENAIKLPDGTYARTFETEKVLNETVALRARVAEVQAQLLDVENREASCCPEDVGFDEYIATLTKRVAEVERERDENAAAHKLMCEMYANRGETFASLNHRAETAERRLAAVTPLVNAAKDWRKRHSIRSGNRLAAAIDAFTREEQAHG